MFERLGRLVGRRPGLWVLGWAAAVVALILASPSQKELATHEPRSLLPADQPYNQALEFARHAFPQVAARTRTVLIFESETELSPDHQEYLRSLSRSLQDAAEGERWDVQSPFTQPFLGQRLLAQDNRAAMIVVNSDTNYLTRRSVSQVEAIETIARESLPSDLRLEITGEGGLGRDLAAASEVAFHRTTVVTLLALMVILAVIYRAPLAALVPLAAIGGSVVAAIMILNQFTRLGWGISTFEKTIVVVLLFGSGTDFALFWLATLRESLPQAASRIAAAGNATRLAGPAITASAATTIAGLLMLMSADLLPSYNAGRALGIALTVSLLAALTLVPALAMLLGKALYWPRRPQVTTDDTDSGAWAKAARLVTNRPGTAVIACAAVLAWPAAQGLNARFTYDAFGIVPADSSAARGEALAREHFSAEQLFSWTCMIHSPAIGDDFAAAVDRSQGVAKRCLPIDGVVDVWSLAHPLGTKGGSALTNLAATDLGRRQAAPFYFAPEHHALRFEIMLASEPLSDAAMQSCQQTQDAIARWAGEHLGANFTLHAIGLTPYILNIKAVSDRDQVRVMALVIAVILVIVSVLVRDVPLACIMLLATWLVYLVTLGATEAFFVHVMGQGGIDWKVKLFAFVILVAVGQDYNIFLVTRLLHERRDHDPRTAARRAISATGSVISSCGAIMAAALGSLAATGLPFFQELGMAFALGVMVDTFLIRPICVPAAYLLLRERRQASSSPLD